MILEFANGVLRFNDEKLPQQSGIYFENQGPMKIITSKWDLTAYFDLTNYDGRTLMITEGIEAVGKYCETIKNTNIYSEQCEYNSYIVNDIYKEIDNRKNLIFETIGHLKEKYPVPTNQTNRPKRKISLNFIKKAAHILFGICDELCLAKSQSDIEILRVPTIREYKLLEKQIKILRVEIERDEGRLYNMREKLNTDLNITLVNFTNEIQIKNHVTNSYLKLSLLLTQYMIEANTIFEIIQFAKLGQIHPKLVSPEELLKQFKDIKISLPSGTDLPSELNIEGVSELLKLSTLAIIYFENHLIFRITIPLVYQHTLTLFHLIPKPVCKDNACIYVNPTYDYLAVSKSKELYSTYDKLDKLYCKNARSFLLCPEIHPLHPRNTRPICEILLFQDPKEVPDSCRIMHVQIATSIYQKLKYKNEWLYVTKGETLFITCDTDKQSTSHAIEGVGILALNETCKAYATRDILIPGELHEEDEYLDFIPKSLIPEADKLLSKPPDKNTIQTKYIKNNEISDLNSIAKSMVQIEETNNLKTIERTQTRSNYLLYVTTAVVVTAIILYVIIGINKITKWIIRKCRAKVNLRPTNEVRCMDSIYRPVAMPTEEPTAIELIGIDIADERMREHLPIQYPRLD